MKNIKKILLIWVLLMGVIFLVVFLFIPLMMGNTRIVGEYSDDFSSRSLVCEKKDVSYDFFLVDDSFNAEVKINAVFVGDRIDSISMIHKTFYNDKATARKMSDAHEGNMNVSFQENGMRPYSFGATYSLDGNVAQMSLYAKSTELNELTIRYFMLDRARGDLDDYKQGYMEQGFSCKSEYY